MKKIFRTITIVYLFCFIACCAYMACSAFNGEYITKQQNHIFIGGGIIAIVLSGINTFLTRKK